MNSWLAPSAPTPPSQCSAGLPLHVDFRRRTITAKHDALLLNALVAMAGSIVQGLKQLVRPGRKGSAKSKQDDPRDATVPSPGEDTGSSRSSPAGPLLSEQVSTVAALQMATKSISPTYGALEPRRGGGDTSSGRRRPCGRCGLGHCRVSGGHRSGHPTGRGAGSNRQI